jgi:aspartate/methionine/tyrosine aminotransferase
MGELLPNNPRIRRATTAQTMTALLDAIEAGYLWGNVSERKLIRSFGGRKDIIDISSATSMNLFHDTTERAVLSFLKKNMPRLLEKFHSYPYLVQRDYGLEKAFIRFMKQWTNVTISLDEVMVLPNGVYGSYKTILLSQPGKYVFAPEVIHQINKACFVSLGKKLWEIPMILETGLLDLEALDRELHEHAKDIACVYIYHTKPVAPLTRAYYLKIARLLKKYDVLGVIDLDSWHTSYVPNAIPWLSFTIPELRKQCLFLFTLTKEIGAPGLRIGFGVGPKDTVRALKKFQQISLEMGSPVTRFLTEIALPNIDMDRASVTLQRRMKALVDGLRSLDFKTRTPPSGVNFFLHVPESFAESREILPDHLFTYYVLTRAHVLLRPASNHGHRMNHWVRFVLGQPEKNIREVIRRFEQAGIRGTMTMPKGLEKEYRSFMRQS